MDLMLELQRCGGSQPGTLWEWWRCRREGCELLLFQDKDIPKSYKHKDNNKHFHVLVLAIRDEMG